MEVLRNPLVFLFFAFLALLAWLLARHLQFRTGLPRGQVVYADPGLWGKPEKPLFDAALGLTGKPDYLVRVGDVLVPVEVKSSWAPAAPYDSHVLQLAAYCLLVESTTGVAPPYGLVRYRNRTFSVEFNSALRERALEIIHLIQTQKEHGIADRSHNEPNRCARCGFRSTCDQHL
jgi:CRISPR-associated exonuclease Cas4